MAERFARLLKRHRIEAGLSQENLAEFSGVSTDEISALERGLRRAPHKATLDLLIAALSLDDDARLEIEEAAKLGRARGPEAQHVLLNNLPSELTSFVDREREMREIKGKLQSHRLVTLVGTGGSGKTRCAIKIAAELLDGSDDGVWFAELGPISDPALVTSVIARTLRVQEAANRPLLDTLLAYLKRKRLLLILDNCEHLIHEARHVAAAILQDCANVRVLATSRESFNIAGEQVYRMPSLPVPSASQLQSASEISHYGAVKLFSDRAASADNRFTLTVESAPYVADICRRLDGIPLAIELAAARVKVLSPRELAQKLDERFRVLTGGDRSALPRHRTMRALIDWSHDLLSDDERQVFRKLSIFAGGFTLETAVAVCSDGENDEIAVLDLLSSLADKSLVQAEVVADDTRYRLLESTRQYAREKLGDAREEQPISLAHARAFLALAQQLFDGWEITPDRTWHAQAEVELDNFRAGLSWAFGPRGDVLLGQCLVGALHRVWYTFAPAEGRHWVGTAQEQVVADTPVAVLASLDIAESDLAWLLNQHKASLAPAERALTRYRELADPRGIAAAQGQIGRAQLFLGKTAEGEALLLQALETFRALGARKAVVSALQCLGLARNSVGDLHGARQYYNEALAGWRVLGADRAAASVLISLAEVEFRHGNADAALPLAREALSLFRAFGSTHIATIAEFNIAAYLVALHRYGEARTASRNAMTAAKDAQFSAGVVWTLHHLAAIAALRPSANLPVIEDRRRAARILGYVDARLAALEALREYTEQQEYDAMITTLRDALDENELTKLMQEGSTLSEDQAVAEAMLI